jgi:hypothetical protein
VAKQKAHKKADTTESMVKKRFKKRKKWKELDQDPEASDSNCWRLCPLTQVEESKYFIRVISVRTTTMALSISFAQLSTFSSQTRTMDHNLGSNFHIPTGSIMSIYNSTKR